VIFSEVEANLEDSIQTVPALEIEKARKNVKKRKNTSKGIPRPKLKKPKEPAKTKPGAKRGPKGWAEEDRVRNGSRRFGAKLKQKRLELGWTQKQMGEALGILQPHMSNLEMGTFAPGAKLAALIEQKFFASKIPGRPRKGAPKA
jgi:DNA-binding XRE family transcriptional regulator